MMPGLDADIRSVPLFSSPAGPVIINMLLISAKHPPIFSFPEKRGQNVQKYTSIYYTKKALLKRVFLQMFRSVVKNSQITDGTPVFLSDHTTCACRIQYHNVIFLTIPNIPDEPA